MYVFSEEMKKVYLTFVSLLTLLILIIFMSFHVLTNQKPKDDALPINATATYQLKSHETIAYSFADLKTALINNNQITTIYLGADINMETSGITVHSSKDNIIINGMDPNDELQTIHTLKDYASSTQSQTIFINSTSSLTNFTLRNLKIIGQNYYGTVSVAAAKSNVVLTYDHVDYSGPQITYNRLGTARYIDCQILIDNVNAGSSAEEVAEIKNVELGGTVTITHTPTTNNPFWYPVQSGYFKVIENAHVTVNATGRNMFYTTSLNVDFIIEKNAYFKCIATTGLMYLDNYLSSMTIEENAQFYLELTSTRTTYPVVKLSGNLTVQNNAIFHMYSSYNTGKVIQFTNATASANFYSPKSVLLYSPNNQVMYWASNNGQLNISANQINYWTTAGSGDFDDVPLYSWRKNDQSNIVMAGTFNTSGTASSITSNYVYSEDTSSSGDLNISNFSLATARVLGFGDFHFDVGNIYNISETIEGYTEVNTPVKVTYGETVSLTQSNSSGYYSINISSALADIDTVKIIANYNFLRKEITKEIQTAGNLEISIPEQLNFEITMLSSFSSIIHRVDPNWHITVFDTRGENNSWSLYAEVIQPLTPIDSTGSPVLNHSIIFIDQQGIIHDLEDQVLIAQHTTNSNQEIALVNWGAEEGIHAFIKGGEAYYGRYVAIIEWTLVNAP